MISSVAVGGGKKAILKLMINCIAVLTLLRPFTGFDISDTVNLPELFGSGSNDRYDAEKELMNYNIKAAELSLKLELEKLLDDNGIGYSEVVINCEPDEYDVITIRSAEVTVNGSKDSDKLKALSQEQMRDIPLTIKAADQQ